MSPSIEKLLVLNTRSIHFALSIIDKTAQGFVIIVDDNGLMCGLLSDGDIRRKMITGVNLDDPVSQVMNSKFIALPMDVQVETLQNMLCEKIRFVPLLDPEGRPVDYANHHRLRRMSFTSPVLGGNELAYVTECIKTNTIGQKGEYVRLFEHAFGAEYQTKFAVATSSGTAALHIVLTAYGIGQNDEIIISNLTDSSIAEAILCVGALPKLVDIDPHTWTLSPEAVESSITPRTRAIIASHVYGRTCDMASLVFIAKRSKILLIEDCSQAIGSSLNGGTKAGSIGDASVFSFKTNKTLTTGEGGLILFKDQEAYNRGLVQLDNGRIELSNNRYQIVGQNYRMMNLQAAIGLAQLEQLKYFLNEKRRIAKKYEELLSVLDGVVLPTSLHNDQCSFDSYPVLLNNKTRVNRDEIISRLYLSGIEAHPFFKPLHQEKCFSLFGNEQNLNNSMEIAKMGLTLPIASTLSTEQIEIVCRIFESILFVKNKLCY